MAHTRLGSPVDYMNTKQLRFRAAHLYLPFTLLTTNAQLISAIKAA